ncbi:hypothetical protein SMACR_12818 [Sordaria macrospora]|uniref:Uncharacterized protein n=1 Tax=Sordaria macrospora TaxID=5147 RepID=A0A8S8ZJE2_SORMA|nr:hypothetical protein SMACR_12818 [Sordaria macrospora]WPJ57229.1 hypothetical protein SMAC4_12818 [Sordaria macrospora]
MITPGPIAECPRTVRQQSNIHCDKDRSWEEQELTRRRFGHRLRYQLSPGRSHAVYVATFPTYIS